MHGLHRQAAENEIRSCSAAALTALNSSVKIMDDNGIAIPCRVHVYCTSPFSEHSCRALLEMAHNLT